MRQARPPAGASVPRTRQVGQISFGVVNFKSIASAQLEPRRLTVVAGSNSSGKSSLLQALLFSAQSFGEPTPVINGDLVRLGEASDVIRDGTEDLTLEFGYPEFSRDEPEEVLIEAKRALHVTMVARDEGRSLAANEISLWRDGECICKANAVDAPKGLALADEERALRISEPALFNLPDESFVTVAGITPSRLVFRADEKELQAEFRHLVEGGSEARWLLDELRSARSVAGDDAKAKRLSVLAAQVSHQGAGRLDDDDLELLFEVFHESEAPAGWSSEPIARLPRRGAIWRRAAEAQGHVNRAALARDMGRALDQVERLADAVLYLGPLRDDPRVAYPLGHTVRALPVGEKGEFTAAYLRENHRARIRYGRPDGIQSSDLLPAAVDRWCEHLGIATRIQVTPQGKLGHQLGLLVGGSERDPTAIGVGASQLLPVVVMVLGAPEGAVVLLEQPELHLHPKVQSRLADFLLYARPKIRIVVETHSEYLLTRLRLRIAEGKLDREQVAVLFATQRVDGGDEGTAAVHTEFSHLNLDELGDFDHWPEDFFDSLDLDSVALARAVAKKYGVRRSDSNL